MRQAVVLELYKHNAHYVYCNCNECRLVSYSSKVSTIVEFLADETNFIVREFYSNEENAVL